MINLWETKSISDEVVNLSDIIADRILVDAPKQQKKISRINKVVYVEGNLKHLVSDIINGVDFLKIHYILYIFDNDTEEKIFFRNASEKDGENLNCWSDFKSGTMQIVSSYVNGVINNDFVEAILHEITHLYQYSLGLEKNDNFYNNVIKMASSSNQIERAVGFSTYYTFRHEQDAMVHQFYGFLLQNDVKGKSFEELLKNSEYDKAIYALNIIKANKREASKYVYKLGISIKQWNYRLHYQYKRFRQKLYNAFLRYTIIDQQQTVKENKGYDINLRYIINSQMEIDRIFKQYPDIEYGIETIYNFEK